MIGRQVSWAVAAPPIDQRHADSGVDTEADLGPLPGVNARPGAGLSSWVKVGLAAILCLAAGLEVVGLDRQGYGNTYYAAAVKSMLSSWESFFFASFDAGNFVSVDKPPLGLWTQALSARVLGFSGVSLFLPQVLAGIASVVLLYRLVRRVAGPAAGLFAALILTVTPINVVTNRNNTMDSQLVLVSILALWAVSLAAEQGKLRWLLVSAALVGLGYNIKMLQAFPVVPGFVLAYALWAPLRLRTRLAHLSAAASVLVLVSFAWSIAVDLTPSESRPFVGSSGSNSALSLALGYNGIGRLYQPPSADAPQPQLSGVTIDLTQAPAFAPQIGNPSPLRLFRPSVADEASWLLVLALLGGIAAGLVAWRRGPSAEGAELTRSVRVALTVWVGWLLMWVGYFSVARFYHLYYLVMLGPAVAALSGIGLQTLWEKYRAGGWKAAALPFTLMLTAAVQIWMLSPYRDWSRGIEPLVIGLAVVSVAGLFVFSWWSLRAAAVALAIGVLSLCIVPAAVAATAIRDGKGGDWLPETGPPLSSSGGQNRGQGAGSRIGVGGGQAAPPIGASQNGGQAAPSAAGPRLGPAGGIGGGAVVPGPVRAPGPGPGVGRPLGAGAGAMTFANTQWNSLDPRLVQYLVDNQGSARFLVGTTTSSYASVFMLASDKPAMALGGYQGWDRIISPDDLAGLVDDGDIRFFYIPSQGGPGRGAAGLDGTAELTSWIRQSCEMIPSDVWIGADPSESVNAQRGRLQRGGQGTAGLQLYRCAPSA